MNFDRRVAFGTLPFVALVGGMAGGMLLVGGNRAVIAQDPTKLTQEERVTAASLEGAFMKIADTAGPATVSITAQIEAAPRRAAESGGDLDDNDPFGELFGPRSPAPRRGNSMGSGVIVRQDGYILTNDHVVQGSRGDQVKVTLADGTSFTGTVRHDPRSDLALVKIDAGKPLPYVRFSDSDRLHVGQWAVAIGSPFGQNNSMTTGIVSALHRKSIIGSGAEQRFYSSLIQTDAAINRGNSGGPLLNIKGELIGINVAIFSPTGTSAGIGFAIPANTAQFVLNQLVAKGKVVRGYLGLTPEDIPAELRTSLGTNQGAYVRRVAPNTPADSAGIQPGDVVTRFGSKEVGDEATLRDAIAATAPGTKVTLALLRDGKPSSVTAVLGEPPALPDAGAPTPSAPRPASQMGFEAGPLTDSARQRFRLGPDFKGVVVSRVLNGSPAAEAGIGPGLVITEVNRTPVGDVAALNKALAAAKSGDVLALRALVPGAPSELPSRAIFTLVVP